MAVWDLVTATAVLRSADSCRRQKEEEEKEEEASSSSVRPVLR